MLFDLRPSKKLFYRKRRKGREKSSIEKLIKKDKHKKFIEKSLCLLFSFLHSGIPSYADECKNEKYTYLFRGLPACRDFLDTLGLFCKLLFLIF